jgi:hypothetical protein
MTPQPNPRGALPIRLEYVFGDPDRPPTPLDANHGTANPLDPLRHRQLVGCLERIVRRRPSNQARRLLQLRGVDSPTDPIKAVAKKAMDRLK